MQEKLDVGYQPEILNFENTYLSGYWQCEKYFIDFRQEVLDLFQFPDQQINLASRNLQEQMRREQAVAVHVRRGDYRFRKQQKIWKYLYLTVL